MRTIIVERDPRGASERYTEFSMVCRDETGRVVWTEGVQHDWCARMYPVWRAIVEPQIRRLCTK